MSDGPVDAGHEFSGGAYWIGEDGSGACPHCGVPVRFDNEASHEHPVRGGHSQPFVKRGMDQPNQRIHLATCTNCGRHVADWVCYRVKGYQNSRSGLSFPIEEVVGRVGVYPGARAPKVESEVPSALARDYREAVAVSHISTRAAAALARRGLQTALRWCGFEAPSRKLNDEIGLALADNRTSSLLAEKLRFVQRVGNDAAHPNLGADGDLIEVTPEDLTVIVATLDEFYDVYIVKPARHAAIMKAHEERKKGPTEPGK